MFELVKPRDKTVEEFVKTWLKEKITPIWPTGWMKEEELKRESEKR